MRGNFRKRSSGSSRTVHSPFLFPRNALIKYDTMSSNAHISNAVSRFFLDSSSIYPDLRRIDEERKSLRGIKRAPGDWPFPPPFKEEKFREIHFIRDVKTRVLTTARRLLLLLRVVF